MSSSNHIKNVAIVGASGRSGSQAAHYLLATGIHTVTALTRPGSKTALPPAIHVKEIDYDDKAGLDCLVITLSITAPHDTQDKLIAAASEAGVPWIIPNGWSPDTATEGPSAGVVDDVPAFRAKPVVRGRIAEGTGVRFRRGGVWVLKEVTLFDRGERKISVSTLAQTGRMVAALLSLPIEPEGDGDPDACLQHFRNRLLYANSFTVSQKDMLESVLRVTGDRLEDWTVKEESSEERFAEAKEAMAKGDRAASVRLMYVRLFYPDEAGNHEKTRGLDNKLLGLPREDLDEATKIAIEMSKNPPW